MIGNLREKLSILESARPVPSAPEPRAADTDIRCRRFHERVDPGAPLGNRTLRDLEAVTAAELSAVFRTGVGEDFGLGQMVFLDTETTGLSGGAGTVAFLIGVGRFADGGFELEQYLMQDYDREADMLERLCGRLGAARYLVTFNGKCFDAPLIASRSVVNRIRQPLDRLTHLDLLHPARRLYRRRLGSCSLGRLEAEALGVVREGDIPGYAIPGIFFGCLRDGDFSRLEQVIAHNRQDILSLGLLLDALCRAWRDPGKLREPWDVYSCGRIFEERRDERAAACYLRAADALPEARAALAGWHRRRGEWDRAVPLWERMTGEDEGVGAYVELAKYYEHRAGDCRKALEWSEKGLGRLCAPGTRGILPEESLALAARVDRLRRRVRAAEGS